jgi:hypothetical protein
MKKFALAVMALALVTSAALAQTSVDPQYLVVPGVSLGPAKLGMTLEEIRAVFGKETRSEKNQKTGVTFLAWSGPGIPGLRAEMVGGKVTVLAAYLLKEYRTAEDIGVGTLADEVEKTYGMPEFQRRMTAQVGLSSVPIIYAWYQAKGLFFGIRTDTNAVMYVGVIAPKN